jgi:hypothetical protein
MTTTEALRGQIPQEEFDYQILMYSLRNLARPRDKISALLKSGSIIRVKKGLYIFGPALSRGPYSRELLSNLGGVGGRIFICHFRQGNEVVRPALQGGSKRSSGRNVVIKRQRRARYIDYSSTYWSGEGTGAERGQVC